MTGTTYFARNLPILRRGVGLTQEALAEALHVSRQAVSKWESGATLPEAATLLSLSELLDCTLDQLMRERIPENFGREELPVPVEEAAPAPGGALLEAYDRHMARFAGLIAAGVLLILVGLAQMMVMLGLGAGKAWGVGGLLICVAAAVFTFVYGGLEHNGFLEDFPGLPDEQRPQPDAAFRRMFQLGIPLAVAGIVGGVALFTVAAAIFHTGRVVLLALGGFFAILGVSVAVLVYLGILKSRYTQEGWQTVSARAKAEGRKEDPRCALVMTGATVIFLLLGFVFDLWHPGWIVFVIGGGICGFLNAGGKN